LTSRIKHGKVQVNVNSYPANAPLLKLICFNIQDACNIGLLDGSATSVRQFIDQTRTSWPVGASDAEQLLAFNKQMFNAKSLLLKSFRPRVAFKGETLKITTVKQFKRFAPWAPIISGDTSFDNLQGIAELDAPISDSDSDPVRQENLKQALNECLRFTNNFGEDSVNTGRMGVAFNARDIQPSAFPFWVGMQGGTEQTGQSAQFWRDRLGMVHIKSMPNPKIADCLVRLQFLVTTSSIDPDPKNFTDQIEKEANGAWLIRTGMTHHGNQRFVQAHSLDSNPSARIEHGRTRDLAHPQFAALERELILAYGSNAELRFASVEMLDGIPKEISKRNNNDDNFVSLIGIERGWN
jgi:hypothetical protein